MTNLPFDACRHFIESQAVRHARTPRPTLPTITISRQAAVGAAAIAQLVAAELQKRQKERGYPWAIFDRNLVEKIVEDHKLPHTVKQFMQEKPISDIGGVVGELLGLHPNSWTLLQYTIETILGLAHAGNVILIGSGSTFMTAHMTNVFRVRLVAPEEKRIAYAEKQLHLSHKEAAEFVRKTERQRKSYIRQNFHADIEDPLHYHLVINTGQVGFEAAAHLIAEAVLDLRLSPAP